MKNLIIVNGTMGAGKTSVCRELQKILPQNVFLDGDWCWDARPFVVNDRTKEMVQGNITHLLNSFICCPEYENIIFCWVLHEQAIIDSLLSRLVAGGYSVFVFTLSVKETVLRHRLQKDVDFGLRTADVIERSVARLPCYENMKTKKIDVSAITPYMAALQINKEIFGEE